MAEARCNNANEHFVRLRRIQLKIFLQKRAARLANDGCLNVHKDLPVAAGCGA
jgi:hypothetical protein